MKSINSRCSVFMLALALLWLAPAARAQDPGDDSQPPRCTDLSGKIPLPCPSLGEPASDTVGVPDEPTAPPTSAAGEARPRGRAHPDTRKNSSAGSVANVGPAAEQPYAAAVRPTVTSQPSAAAADPRAAIGLHPRTPPEPEPSPEPSPVASSSPASRLARSPELSLVRNLVSDQKAIWGSPLRIRLDNVQWLVPLLGVTAVVMASDTDIQNQIPTSASFRKNSNSFSNYGVAAFAGVTGATWLWGVASHNDHMRETGVLSGEAALDSFALTYAIKSITQRDRPYQSNGHGNFWSKGDSFPSEHAAAAWSVATVFAHEYPGPLTKFFAYGGAAAISVARVTADKHFASDALVGSALGYFIGRQVYRAHHDQGSGDAAYGTFERTRAAEGPRGPENMGSTYVALDSWVYGAMDRLAALGYINSAFAGLRPWTRMECARLLQEAERRLASDAGGAGGAEAARLYRSLQSEFLIESHRLSGDRNLSVELESVYTRFTGISGKPLNDSYHFGQTITNDYGRPYQEGFNMVSGFTSHAEAGPLAFYVRGEYQHSPSAPPLSASVRDTIGAVDGLPTPPAVGFPSVNRLQLLEAYAALTVKDWQLSFGKQSLWWGPGQGSAFLFTNDAQPALMLRLSRVSPITLPGFLGKWLGPIRTEAVFGQLRGQQFVDERPENNVVVGNWTSFLNPQPYFHAEKFNLKPTPNLDLGVSLIAEFGGPGLPLSWSTYFRTFNNSSTGQHNNGNRITSFQFSYRLPGLRNWLTLYCDSDAEDEPNPIAYPRRSAMNPGIYLSHVPQLPRLDFRVEGGYTDLPNLRIFAPFYYDYHFRNGWTNYGVVMGSWLGRQGRGVQARSTYWFAPRKTLQVGYRYANVSDGFIPHGGTLSDFSIKSEWLINRGFAISSFVQYERWGFPVVSPTRQSNVTAQFQLTFRPMRSLLSRVKPD